MPTLLPLSLKIPAFIVPFVLLFFNRHYKKLINTSHFDLFLFPLPVPATLPTIKSGEVEIKTKNSSKGRTACDYPLYLSRLKNFVKISDYTRFCVDTENAAV